MIIHVVEAGDTLSTISERYHTTTSRIIADNGLVEPFTLVIGSSLVITIPMVVYTVVEGDTLESIATARNTSVVAILQNNPSLIGRSTLYPGETIVMAYEDNKYKTKRINGYAYPYVDPSILILSLPYLSTLTVFGYDFTEQAELIPINDEPIISLAREYHTAPIMLVSSLTEEGRFSNERAAVVLNDPVKQERLIQSIITVMNQKGYIGLDVDFEYIEPYNKQAFISFIENIAGWLHANGFILNVALAPKTSADQPGLLYEAHDYYQIGQIADTVQIMTYEWGYTYGSPMAVAPLNRVREVLEYAVTEIDPNKIMMGIPNYGYDWRLPFEQGVTRAESLGNEEAVALAARVGARIEFDEIAQTPFFHYYGDDGAEHVVWFEDARSIYAKLELLDSLNLLGAGYWSVMKPFTQNWVVLNSKFYIDKSL